MDFTDSIEEQKFHRPRAPLPTPAPADYRAVAARLIAKEKTP
jgi:hypothetical protein